MHPEFGNLRKEDNWTQQINRNKDQESHPFKGYQTSSRVAVARWVQRKQTKYITIKKTKAIPQ